MDRSVILDAPDGPLVTVTFESLVVDENRAAGQLLFRLAESASTVIVHADVVDRLVERGAFGLTFVDPAEYAG